MNSLLLVPMIAVLTVTGFSFPEDGKDPLELELRNTLKAMRAQPSENCETSGGECKKYKGRCKGKIVKKTCGEDLVCCITEAKAQDASELMLQILSNTLMIQGMAVKTIKEDQENSIKNLTKAIANLETAVEIKLSNLTDAMSNEQENMIEKMEDNQDIIMSNLTHINQLQGMIRHLSDDMSNQGMALQINQASILSNLSDGFSAEENVIKNMEDNQDIIMSSLTRIGCPEGFFQLRSSGQCMKFFYDQKRSWSEAKEKCQNEGLQMAHPTEPVELQAYLVNKYGNGPSKDWPSVWIYALGSGSNYFIWQDNSGRIYWYDPYWYSRGINSTTYASSRCMYIMTSPGLMMNKPGKPYMDSTCTNRYHYTLCELINE